ncbi:uncharacterized protein MYCGRDRAFT_103556, partial [Zymoseptoria tritici IPO323]
MLLQCLSAPSLARPGVPESMTPSINDADASMLSACSPWPLKKRTPHSFEEETKRRASSHAMALVATWELFTSAQAQIPMS